MSWTYKYIGILSRIAPLGIAGATIALAPSTSADPREIVTSWAGKEHLAEVSSVQSNETRVSERLAAIREVVEAATHGSRLKPAGVQ